MSNIPCIAVKHQDCDIGVFRGMTGGSRRSFLWSDVECMEFFAVGCGDHKFLKVGEAELGGFGNLLSREVGNVRGVNEGFLLEV